MVSVRTILEAEAMSIDLRSDDAVEVVAKALCEWDAPKFMALYDGPAPNSWDSVSAEHKHTMRQQARAVLDALMQAADQRPTLFEGDTNGKHD